MTNPTVQDIFEMRRNKQFEQAYAAVVPLYQEHQGHYTTICMFWTACDVMRLRIDAGQCKEAEQIFASLREIYPTMEDRDNSAARNLNRLALSLASKEQELAKLQQYKNPNQATGLQFSLLDYMLEFGNRFLTEEDWQSSTWNNHPMPSTGTKIVSRIFHEVSNPDCNEMRLNEALNMVLLALQYAPQDKHLLRYEANLMYRLGDKQRAIDLYRQLTARNRESYLFSELAGMIDDRNEQAALLSQAILNQCTEVFAQKDRLSLAALLKELFPQHAAFELHQVVQLRESLGQQPNRAIISLQKELADIVPVSLNAQREFYKRIVQDRRICA